MCFVPGVWAQDSITPIKKSNAKSAVINLSQSLEDNEPDDAVAARYEELARELAAKGEYLKAEVHLNRARELYRKTKNVSREAIVFREIGKMKEAQNELREAIFSYDSASQLSLDNSFKELNTNDANRLRNVSNPLSQAPLIQRNIDILNNDNKYNTNTQERSAAFQQMAHVNMQMNKKEEALSNLQDALNESKDSPLEITKVQREIANVYVASNQPEEATTALKTAYELSLKEGHTIDAKKNLELLVEQYQKEKKTRLALDTYAGFMSQLEPLIKSDSTLIDNRFFQVHENRIAQLEKERALKDELIHKQTVFNTVLQGSIILILIFLLFIIRAWYSIKKKNKKIALQSLRREMNPHFIFNSLNSVNQYIAQNNELEANKYLSSYSRLMRNMMENSNKDFTSLSTELEQLKEYLDLESLRFQEKFTYRIEVDESLDTDSVCIPNMLIQPQLENAIWHGLRYKEEKGLLLLSVRLYDNELIVNIEDNGIGRKKSQELKTKHQKDHKSRGLTNTSERISLLNSLYNCHISMEIKDKEDDTGVIVMFRFPLKNNRK